MPIELNTDQSACVDEIVEFYHTPGQYFYCVKGWAGVGKTFTIQRAIKRLLSESPRLRIALTAPTNKAVKVLSEMAADYGLYGVHTITIYSSLGLILDSSGEEKQTRRLVKGNFEDLNLVVVDEASMISKNLWRILSEAAREYKVKVILMGDPFQLPPVKEKESQVFDSADKTFTLSKIMRQEAGNPILELTASLREDIRSGKSQTKFHDAYSGAIDCGVYVMNAVDWYENVRENFSDEEYRSNPDKYRIGAWTNKRVNAMNKAIRRLLVGETKSPFIVGERVLTRQPILEEIPGERPEVVVNTDEECDVLEVRESTHPEYEGMSTQFKVWTLLLSNVRNRTVEVHLLHEDSESDYRKMLSKLADEAKKNPSLWRNFWAFKDSFGDLQPPHAMTVHRMQGSTFENVFLDVDDCFKNLKSRERNQLLYVGCSRASHNLLLLKR
ncbi:MAG: AAA family ATPase [Candidatus Bathyarchaeota archaeon]|jgi:hypothetical protein